MAEDGIEIGIVLDSENHIRFEVCGSLKETYNCNGCSLWDGIFTVLVVLGSQRSGATLWLLPLSYLTVTIIKFRKKVRFG
ncbi:hypothetical protein L1987_23904 [Smallanthus sonchifolius]|uniref:Uncharacterized protein n=1 Tax=Smallanthus sonchifolius TaxID=185202 RepID=A0ACB9IKP5_9ASTR|nr:hypothetical protein L1987_23904 [Smallanthus sonchifolius]